MNKMRRKSRQTILIADDLEINRALLSDMLGNEFEIIEAEDGAVAVATLTSRGSEIDLVLLDIVMPKMDGFEVLAVMNRNGWIKDIPVIMISSETSSSYIERAYELGVTEFINRPFDAWIVRKRVMNTLMLSGKQKKLVGLVTDQIYEREKMSNLMITVLSHIVEFRNGESGLHVLHIRTIVDLLIRALSLRTKKYGLSQADASLIATASALHDIGKIGIPDEILNKPGRLTEEEFAVMKTHTTIGADMLDSLDFIQDEKLIKYAAEICRWHHERYDGKGYPDGLKGEEIPISAQIVSVADVYDALTSERVYKKAFSHEKALQMIAGGECGTFNPILLECLQDVSLRLVEELKINSFGQDPFEKMQRVTDEIMQHEELSTSARTLTLLENERIKNRFYAELSHEIQFEYVYDPSMLMIFDFGEKKLGLDEIIMNPIADKKITDILGGESIEEFKKVVDKTTPENYSFSVDLHITLGGEQRWVRVVGRTLFAGESSEKTGVIGKVVDITKERAQIRDLQHKATHDQLTLLFNNETAREKITERLRDNPDTDYVMLMMDLDYFKDINDTYGHEFGNQVLKHIAGKLKAGLRRGDIIARFGGDEFLVLFEGHKTQDATIKRIFESLTQPFRNLPISVSMGVADTACCGRDFETLFNCADRAAYEAKRSGKKHYCYFNASLTEEFPEMSGIDDGGSSLGGIRLSRRGEMKTLLKELRRVFENVYILDAEKNVKYSADQDGAFGESVTDEVFEMGKSTTTERAFMTKGRACGIGYRGNEVYRITACYLECEDIPYVLEIMIEVGDTEFAGVYDRAQIIGMIDRQGNHKYEDESTGAFNRKYFDEQLGGAADFYSVAVIGLEGGADHAKEIAEALVRSVRNTDAVVHEEADRFAIMLKRVTGKRFEAILKEIYAALEEMGVNPHIGALRALGKPRDLMIKAAKNAEKARAKKERIFIQKEKKEEKD